MDAMLRGFLESDDSRRVNQVPEPRPIKIENSPSEVHGRVVIEETAHREVDDGLCDGALPRSRWPMEVKQLHRNFHHLRVRLTSGIIRAPTQLSQEARFRGVGCMPLSGGAHST